LSIGRSSSERNGSSVPTIAKQSNQRLRDLERITLVLGAEDVLQVVAIVVADNVPDEFELAQQCPAVHPIDLQSHRLHTIKDPTRTVVVAVSVKKIETR
jgi:hypothetical protein